MILFFSGLFLVAWGLWLVYKRRDYVFGGGMFLIGIGNLSLAVTNGFTNMSPQGRLIIRFGAFSYIVGILCAAYSMRHLVM